MAHGGKPPLAPKTHWPLNLPPPPSPIPRKWGFSYGSGDRSHHGVVQNPYPLPNDLEEQIRLDEQHFAMSSCFGGNVLVKLRKPTKILDIGTGSGKEPPSMSS